jgi:fibronectin type 3 domain-containing protein
VRRIALCLLILASTGCAARLDVDRARRWLNGPEAPALPRLDPTPRADLPAPERLSATSGELRKVPLSWEPVMTGDVAGYAIERSEQAGGGFEWVAAVVGRANTVYVDDGEPRWPGGGAPPRDIRDDETLHYRVRAFDSAGALSRRTSPAVAGTTAPAPDPPEELRAYSRQPRKVPLSWRAASDERVAGYVIERSPTSSGPFEPIAEIDGRHETVYVDRGLGDLRMFYYRVASVNVAGGRGAFSAPVRAVTKPDPLPPIGLRVAAQRLGANQLAWEPNVEPDLAGYQVRRLRQGADRSEPVATVGRDATEATDPAVGADERVAYWVLAFDSDGLVSEPTEPLQIASVGYELTATARRDGVELAWNPRSDEGFAVARVYLHGALGSTSELGAVRGSNFLHADVKPGGRYRYSVQVERRDGTRAPISSPVEIAIPEE